MSECISSFKTLAQVKTTNLITFVRKKETQEQAISIEDYITKKGVDNKPSLQHAFKNLNEGTLGIGGSRKQDNMHENKPKRYGKTSLVCFYYKKKGHKVYNSWYSSACSFQGMIGH